jgi:hypothetical protein
MYNCTLAQAKAWLDYDDAQAIDLANKRLNDEPCIEELEWYN